MNETTTSQAAFQITTLQQAISRSTHLHCTMTNPVTLPSFSENLSLQDDFLCNDVPVNCFNYLMNSTSCDDYEIDNTTTRCPNDGIKAAAWCKECNEFFCHGCLLAHNRVRLTKEHFIIKLTDSNQVTSSTVQPIGNTSSFPFSDHGCNIHDNEPLAFYCEFCRQGLCTKCRYGAHANHSITILKDAVLKYKNQSFQLLSEARTDLIKIEEFVLNSERMSKRIETRVQMVAKEIHTVAGQFKNLIDERERGLLQDLNKIRRLKENSLHLQLEELKGFLLNLKKSCDTLALSLKNGVNREVFTVQHLVSSLIQDIRKNKSQQEPTEDDYIFYRPPERNIKDIGILSSSAFAPHCYATGLGLKTAYTNRVSNFVVNMNDHLGEKCKMDKPNVKIQGPGNTILQTEITDKEIGSFIISYQPLVAGDHLISITIRGIHIQLSPFTVTVRASRNFSSIGKMILSFGTVGTEDGQLCRPWGVCCDRNGHIIVADRSNNRIQVFDMQGTFIRKFGSMGTRPGQFDRPAGVVVDKTNRLIVADKDNHRLQVFSLTGEYICIIGEKGSHNGQFNYPWDVAVNSDNQILVSDTRNHRIQLFSPEGNFLKKYGFDGHMWKKFDSPRGVCFNSRNEMLVTDFNNHRVLVLNSVFQEVNSIGLEGGEEGMFLRPQGVDVSDDGHIVVADSKNHRVQIFSPTGSFVCAFGGIGKEDGQMDRPSGVCVSPEGYVIVVDFGNTRIQIF